MNFESQIKSFYQTYSAQLYSLYYQFLDFFPPQMHGAVSFVLAILLIYAIYKVLKRNFGFLILLVLLLPQTVPMLKSIWENLFGVLNFLLKR